MKSKLFLPFCFTLLISTANAQTVLQVTPLINLPKDSVEAKALTHSLTEFLIAANKPNEENKWVFENEKVETFILLDEMAGMEKSGRFKDDYFYKPYLTNVVLQEPNQYLIQISYMGVNANTSYLVGSYVLIAHKSGNSFLFSSPLLQNTKNWKSEKVGNNIFHYQTTINKAKVNEFARLSTTFDVKLKSKVQQVDLYCSDNISHMLRLIGVDYKSEYNGRTDGTTSSSYNYKSVVVFGDRNPTFNNFDPHDLWHDRLRMVLPRSKVYRPVDEACAYLYGGSWGMSWKEILKRFKEKVASDKNTNWMEVKEKLPNFGESMEKHLIADYVVNALIVQKLEKEKGFAAVWELLTCGKWEAGNEDYYKALEKLSGITKANYNDKVWELIKKEM